VSDEFISDRYTFCVISDRNQNFVFPNYWFCKIGHVTPEDMEMSGIALRIEWKHSRVPAGPPSGRNRPLKSRNLGFRRQSTFFQSLGEIENGRTKKKMLSGESKVFLGGWNWSGVLRGPGGCASLHKGPHPSRKAQMSLILLASYPIFDLASSGP
jgi:hypothetical protein